MEGNTGGKKDPLGLAQCSDKKVWVTGVHNVIIFARLAHREETTFSHKMKHCRSAEDQTARDSVGEVIPVLSLLLGV